MDIEIDDLRSQKRRKASHKILVSYPCQDGGDERVKHTCSTEDISESGLKLVTRHPLPLGTKLPITVTINEQEETKFEFLGEVKWCLEVDNAPTYFAGIKLVEVLENNYKEWKSIANR